MSEAGLHDGVGFAVTVPASWIELPLDPVTRDDRIADLVRQRLDDVPELRPHRSTVTRLLRGRAREAWASGARWAAGMVEPADEGPLTASAAVSVVPGPRGVPTDDRDAYLEALTGPLAPIEGSDDGPWRRVAAVALPGDVRGVRAWGVEDVDLPDGLGAVRTVTTTQLVPVPGTDQVLLLACASPVVPLAEVLHDLFDAVCGTLRLVTPEHVASGAEVPA